MKKVKTTFVFAGGGTGGHLFPAIAVAEALQQRFPEAEMHFIGRSDKLEAVIVPQHGFFFHSIAAEGFSRKNVMVNLRVLLKFVTGFFQSLSVFVKYKPAAAITTGAYISAPVIAAARVFGTKVFMVEPNSYPGLVTRLFDKSVERVFITFEETKKYLRNPQNTLVTGNPVRKSFSEMNRNTAKVQLGFTEQAPLVLITGGSLGAKKLNETVSGMVEKFTQYGYQCLWQTGKNYYEQYKQFSSKSIKVVPFIENMAVAINAADIMVARAGATTIAEIMALGIASILVPSPNVAENHQFYNAKALADKNAAVLIEEKNIDENLFTAVHELCSNTNELETIRKQAKLLHKEQVAENIADCIVNTVTKG